jgi:hypothetical protein
MVNTDLRYEPLGLGPKRSKVRIEDGTLHVRFGWGFRTAIPLTSIKDAKPSNRWGAHGWRGRWLVNGSSKDIVELTIALPVRAYVMGAPIKLQTLYVSVTDPQALIAACVPT